MLLQISCQNVQLGKAALSLFPSLCSNAKEAYALCHKINGYAHLWRAVDCMPVCEAFKGSDWSAPQASVL